MAKLISTRELATIITALLVKPELLGELDSPEKHRALMEDLGVLWQSIAAAMSRKSHCRKPMVRQLMKLCWMASLSAIWKQKKAPHISSYTLTTHYRL